MTVGVILFLHEAHPIAQALDFANICPFILVELAKSHKDLVLLAFVRACHERYLKLVPKHIWVFYCF